MTSAAWPWLALLGASHGINPGMGWLFAAALGMQEGRGRAVWRALLPLALGHALAVGAVVIAGLLVGRMIPIGVIKPIVAFLLIGYGVYRIVRGSHPRFGGMRMSLRDLTVWSFLMASAHGAGFMVLPAVLGDDSPRAVPVISSEPVEVRFVAFTAEQEHVHEQEGAYVGGERGQGHEHVHGGGDMGGLVATLVHTAAYLLVTALIALAVFHWLGVRWIRRAWVNLDLIWGLVLIATGLISVL